MTTWGVYIDWARDNSFGDAADAIWEDVVEIKWRLGMGKPYQVVAEETPCIIKVRNADGKYNPENGSSPLIGKLLPHRPVKITANGNVMWRGWIAHVEPDWSPAGAQTGQTLAVIHCTGAKQLLQDADVNLPLQQDKRPDEIIAEVLKQIVLPPALPGGWLIGAPGFSEIGINTVVGSPADYSNLEIALTTLKYYGDIKEGATDGYRIIKEVTEAERGRFFFDRAGKAIWWNRHHLLLIDSSSGVIDSSGAAGVRPAQVQYQHGASLANMVEVTVYPRQPKGTLTLWTLDSPISIPPGQAITFEALFTEEGQQRTGALSVSPTGATFSSGTADISLKVQAERAQVTLINTGAVPAEMTGLTLEGEALAASNRLVVRAQSDASIGLYGRRSELKMNLRALSDYADAYQIAHFELYRRQEPRGEVTKITLLQNADNTSNAAQLAWTIGTRIAVLLPEIGHTADYFIIGEEHTISEGGRVHKTSYILEPAMANFWLIGVAGFSEIGVSTVVAY